MYLEVQRVLDKYFYKTQKCIKMTSHHFRSLKFISGINEYTEYTDSVYVNNTKEL